MTKSILALSIFTAAGLAGCTAPGQVGNSNEAALVSPDIVIAEVFAGGGNSGATFSSDFVVLFNRGTAAASLNGLNLDYSNTAGTTKQTLALPNASIPVGGYYLIAQAADSSSGALTPDLTGLDNMSTLGGRVAVAGSTFSATDNTTWTDLVGWGTDTEHEGASALALTATNADIRAAGGCTDTGNNLTDLPTGTAVQKSSATTAAPCSTTTPTEDMATAKTDMAETSSDDAGTTTTKDGGTTSKDDGGTKTPTTVDGGDAIGNQPQGNGTPTLTPGGNLHGGCSVGGNGMADASAIASAIAGLALFFRRRRAS